MSGEPVANDTPPEVVFSGNEGLQVDERCLTVTISGDVVVIDLRDAAGTLIGSLNILGSDGDDGRAQIGIFVDKETQDLTATVYGPLERMTSEHVRRSGRSVAAFPGSNFVEVEIVRKEPPDVG